MSANAPVQKVQGRMMVVAGLVLAIVASIVLAVAAPLLVGSGVAWVVVAGATACAIVAGVGVMFAVDRLATSPVAARPGLDLAA